MSSAKDAAADNPQPPVRKQALYEYHKIYPRKIKDGIFRRLKWIAMIVLMGTYFIGPFLRWDRGPGAPDQAILIDMPGERAYFFSIEIWPQEVYYLTGILILAAIGLFFVTALLGRVWCGFTCWQTVWTDFYVWIEEMFEGDRNARIKLDAGPWTTSKILRKTGKHTIWAVFSLLTGMAFVLYCQDAFQGTEAIFSGQATATTYGFVALFGGLTYLLAGWAREQVCIYMCPWPRFQAAMFDEDSLVVTYEAWRGEPRRHAKRGETFEGRGHCVDCRMCVQVCPTGIDIRDGSQLACIGCALCVDACNGVMDRFGLPRGLISYDSTANMVARSKGEPTRIRLVRGRTVTYVCVLALVGALMVYSLATRHTTEVNILQERSPLYVPLSNGTIRNGYTYKILNMIREDRKYTLSIEGIEGASLQVIGYEDFTGSSVDLPVQGDTVGTFRIYVAAPLASLQSKMSSLRFKLLEKGKDGARPLVEKAPFAGPEK